jgi:hypothetical protein
MKGTLVYTGAIILISAIGYGLWVVGKTINYKLSYQSMVEDTVCSMVKPEYLKEECN